MLKNYYHIPPTVTMKVDLSFYILLLKHGTRLPKLFSCTGKVSYSLTQRERENLLQCNMANDLQLHIYEEMNEEMNGEMEKFSENAKESEGKLYQPDF